MTILNLSPRLVVDDAARAIDFYIAAFGAKERQRHAGPDGRIVHAELALGPATLALKDAGDGDPAPPTLGGTPVILTLQVGDVDAVADALTASGAAVVYPVSDQEYGARDGRFRDPFGHLWIITQALAAPPVTPA
jgi:uncharacterized glyoxalase superfamily protein PhnB